MLGFGKNGKPVVVYGIGTLDGVGKIIGVLLFGFLGFGVIAFIFSLILTFIIGLDLGIYGIVNKFIPFVVWFYPAYLDRFIGLWEQSMVHSFWTITGALVVSLILFFLWRKYKQPGKIKTIVKLFVGSNLAILIFRFPLYVILAAYVWLVGMDDFHLYKGVDVEYVNNESGYYANHPDATIEVYHSELFDREVTTDIHGNEYDDYMLVTSGVEDPNHEETNYWTIVSLNLYEKVEEITFTGTFIKQMEVSEVSPIHVSIRTNRDMDNEQWIHEQEFTSINQMEEFRFDVTGAELVDIIISSDNEFNFGIFELKKYMLEDA